MPAAQDVLRELIALNKRRTGEGIGPIEYQRWLDLAAQLKRQFPRHPPLGGRGETQIRVEFQDSVSLLDAAMFNVKPVGIYLSTPFAAEVGVRFGLVVFVKQTGGTFRGRVEVISNNIGPDYSTVHLGMGMKFVEQHCELSQLLEDLHAQTG
jgi:hypothetical protein